jgi:hypothetical protein
MILFCGNFSDAKRDGSMRFASEAGKESAKSRVDFSPWALMLVYANSKKASPIDGN